MMKLKWHALLLTLLVFTASAARAASVWDESSNWFSSRFDRNAHGSSELFSAEELSLDAFVSAYDNDRHVGRNVLNGQWGGGLGGNYFVTRELGVTLDSNIANNGRNFIDYLHASAVFRWPFEEYRIAPYVLVGVGYDFDPNDEITEHAGVGAEYRLNSMTGFFLDTRYVLTDESKDYWVFRAGVRFVF